MLRMRSRHGSLQSKASDGTILRKFGFMFRGADYINGYVVFNIRRNRYGLITVIHNAMTTDEKRTGGHVYIRFLLTHKEYNDPWKWDRRFDAK
jgi:mRNA interferase HigB